jgi:hypothetical protein
LRRFIARCGDGLAQVNRSSYQICRNDRGPSVPVSPRFCFKLKSPTQSKGPWDCYTLVKRVPGQEAFRKLDRTEVRHETSSCYTNGQWLLLVKKCRTRKIAIEAGKYFGHRAVSRARQFVVGKFPLDGNHVKVGCKLATFGAVSRAAITASTVIDAIRIINSDTGQVAP